jgi:hypothetical protein
MDDDQLVACLARLGVDWAAAPAKMRTLLQEAGVQGVSEKRLKRLKAARTAPVDAPSTCRLASSDAVAERNGRGRCAFATQRLSSGTVIDDFSGMPST